MNIHTIYQLLLFGHVLGDFYLQSNIMAKEKDSSFLYLLIHACTYSACMGLVLWIGIPFSYPLLWLWFSVSMFHLAIDSCKRFIKIQSVINLRRQNAGYSVLWLQNHIFIVDQCLHLFTLGIAWWFWGANLVARIYVERDVASLPAKPLPIILGILLILRPIGKLIEKGEIWKLGGYGSDDDSRVIGKENAGKMIGYLERTILFYFLIYNQYSTIAFILTAKSVARYKEINSNKLTAEDYLIGTLLSVVSVMVVEALLGL